MPFRHIRHFFAPISLLYHGRHLQLSCKPNTQQHTILIELQYCMKWGVWRLEVERVAAWLVGFAAMPGGRGGGVRLEGPPSGGAWVDGGGHANWHAGPVDRPPFFSGQLPLVQYLPQYNWSTAFACMEVGRRSWPEKAAGVLPKKMHARGVACTPVVDWSG